MGRKYTQSRKVDTKIKIGRQVQILRKRKGLSQDALAEMVGIDAKSLSRIERGAHYPAIETLERLANAMKLELKDFFDFDGRPSVEEMRSQIIRSAQAAGADEVERMAGALQSIFSSGEK